MAATKPKLEIILAGDIGGTNTTFALVESGAQPNIIHKTRYDTQDIQVFSDSLNAYLAQAKEATGKVPSKACLAIAGPVHDNKGKLTHAAFEVDAHAIVAGTSIKQCLVINDFDAVSFAIGHVAAKEVSIVKKGKACPKQPISVIGAGTGLGKSLLVYEESRGAYVPVPSETGHGDLIVHTAEEMEFANYTRKKLNMKAPASWEMVLSGRGIVNVYEFLREQKFGHKEAAEIVKNGPSPDRISANRKTDALCKETFEWFERFYARLAKNAVMDNMCRGGVYIAGGIVTKNPDMFGQVFSTEFCDNLRLGEILQEAPVWAILNYYVSLIGCAGALNVWKERIVKK